MAENEIYFHVGLGKTASKFLQHKVFPKLKGIEYLPTHRYRHAQKLIKNSSSDKILVSREFDNQLEEETLKFARHFPQAKVIIILRRHDSWLASQYRRYVKNGGSLSFDAFFDLEKNQGIWKTDKTFFYPKIEFLEKLFQLRPLVLFYEDLKKNPITFIESILKYTGTHCNMDEISLKPHHASYNEKQLKVMRKVAGFFFSKKKRIFSQNPLLNFIQKRVQLLVSYFFLYTALLIPDFLLSKKSLIPAESLERVKKYYEDDWNKCKSYCTNLLQKTND